MTKNRNIMKLDSFVQAVTESKRFYRSVDLSRRNKVLSQEQQLREKFDRRHKTNTLRLL